MSFDTDEDVESGDIGRSGDSLDGNLTKHGQATYFSIVFLIDLHGRTASMRLQMTTCTNNSPSQGYGKVGRLSLEPTIRPL